MQYWLPMTGDWTGWMARKADRKERGEQFCDDYIRTLRPTQPYRISYVPPMNDELHEYRYEQRGNEYQLRCWNGGREFSQRGFVTNMPEWLKSILATAKVAGVIRPIKEPPPEVIVWFRTDDNHNLVEFIEMA